MRAIHSFWFKPILERGSWGGFPSEKPFWYAWLLSFAMLKKHFQEVVLYTDSFGAKQVKMLGLSYDKVSTDFDIFDSLPSEFWALPKLHVYSHQRAPFIHCDTDAILWNKPEDSLLKAPVFAQSPENHVPQRKLYSELVSLMRNHLKFLPQSYYEDDLTFHDYAPLNCGVVGGTDHQTISKYAEESMRIIQDSENAAGFSNIRKQLGRRFELINCAVEQLNLSYHCKASSIRPQFLLKDDSVFLADRDESKIGYSHLVGTTKNNAHHLYAIQDFARSQMPRATERIEKLAEAREAKLFQSRASNSKVQHALQTFWFEPFIGEDWRTFSAGFREPKYFWYAFALSFIGIRRKFKHFEIVTDAVGKRLIENEFAFPYDRVTVDVDAIEDCKVGAWNAGKFYTYLRQSAPFLHFDCDAFFRGVLPERLLHSDLVVESFESGEDYAKYYERGLGALCKFHDNIGSDYKETYAQGIEGKIAPPNCGIFGGTNLELIHGYARDCLRMLLTAQFRKGWDEMQRESPEDLSAAYVSVEQIGLIFWLNYYRVGARGLYEPGQTEEEKSRFDYFHLIGHQKQNPENCRRVEALLDKHAPEWKQKIDKVLSLEP